MSNENAGVLAQGAATAPAAPAPVLVVCRLSGEDFVTTPESCAAMGGTVVSRTSPALAVKPDELIVCQLSGEDFVTTPESCLAMGGTIVGGSSPTPAHPARVRPLDSD
jgi:hypothetical protein